jgi:hypothetical protein
MANQVRIDPKEREKLINQAEKLLGGPIRTVQLDDEQYDAFIQMATEDYVEYVHTWLIDHQWPALVGIDLDEADLTRAFTVRSLDYTTQFTYAYSKIAGLGTGEGGWVLKKDFINLEEGKQIYEIPPNREVNEVMWFTPATMDQSVIDPFLGVWNNHFGAEYLGLGSYYIMPAFDVLLRAADRNLKNRIIRSELTYRITNGPNGKKYLHLYPTPGGKFSYRSRGYGAGRVWYWYYDIYNNRNECLEANKDIVKTPDDIPLEDISYEDINQQAKSWVRRYFIAICKEALGRVRGTYSGRIPFPQNEMSFDYQSLLSEGQNEKENLKEELKERLDRLHPTRMLERMANEAEMTNKALYYREMKKPIRVI